MPTSMAYLNETFWICFGLSACGSIERRARPAAEQWAFSLNWT